MIYHIAKTCANTLSIHSPEWETAELGVLTDTNWAEKAPETTFRILRRPDGFSLLFHTNEEHLRAEVTEENGSVCTDSCLEFFFKPDPHDVNYINFEVNPKCVMHIGLGKDRYNRLLIDEPRSTFCAESEANDGDWWLKYDIPDSFLLKYFKEISPASRANLYKCGDSTDHPHYATWAPVLVTTPDFHLADFFDKLLF